MKIFVFHGFGTCTKTSNFCQGVKAHYAQTAKVYPIKYNYLTSNPLNDFEQIRTTIANHLYEDDTDEELYFYGISLGGFIARYFAHTYEGSAALFNPSVYPWLDVNGFVKKTPLIASIPFGNLLVRRVIKSAKMCQDFFFEDHLQKQAVVLSKDDDILEWQKTYDFFKDNAYLHLNDLGGHTLELNNTLKESLKHLDENWLHDNKESS